MSVANRPQSTEKHNKAGLTPTKLPQPHGCPFQPHGAPFSAVELMVDTMRSGQFEKNSRHMNRTFTSDPRAGPLYLTPNGLSLSDVWVPPAGSRYISKNVGIDKIGHRTYANPRSYPTPRCS